MTFKFTITRVPEGFDVREESLVYPPGCGIHPSLAQAQGSVETGVGRAVSWDHSDNPENGPASWTTSVEIEKIPAWWNPRRKT